MYPLSPEIQPREPKPENAVKWGKCPACEEYDWLYKWEGSELMCEGCIDEAHDRMHEAEDAMAESADVDPSDFDADYGDDYGDEYGEGY